MRDNQAPQADIAGMVLAGGRSRRLGQDKILLRRDGESYLARAVALLSRLCGTVVVSGRDPSLPDATGATPGVQAAWLPDAVQGVGPMGGIIAGLRRLERPLLVMACDLPLMDEATLRRLLVFRASRPQTAMMTTYLQRETGFIEALVAVYEPGALSYLEASCAQGVYKLSQALPKQVRHELPYSCEESAVFFNINRPQDLQELQRRLTARVPTAQEASCS